jgi:hypothetical protein
MKKVHVGIVLRSKDRDAIDVGRDFGGGRHIVFLNRVPLSLFLC